LRVEPAPPEAERQSVQDPLGDWPDTDTDRKLSERTADDIERPKS
jgi:hypothetical protein